MGRSSLKGWGSGPTPNSANTPVLGMLSDTVDGRNPAAVVVGSLSHYLFTRFYTSQVVQDFFHQQ